MKKGSSVPDVEVQGLCGSGLIDAIAVMLDLGILNRRGRIQKAYYGDEKNRIYAVTDHFSDTRGYQGSADGERSHCSGD